MDHCLRVGDALEDRPSPKIVTSLTACAEHFEPRFFECLGDVQL